MSVANSNQWVANGPQYLFWAMLNGRYPYGTTGTIANGSSSGMGRLRGVDTMSISEPSADRKYALGDNGVITSFLNQPQSLPGGALTLGVTDQTFNIAANGVKQNTLSDWDISGGFPLCFTFGDMCMVVNEPANSEESTSLDEAGWAVTFINKSQVQSKIISNKQTATPAKFENEISVKRSTFELWGEAYSVATHGSTAFAYRTFMSPYPVKLHTFIGDNATVTFTLDETPVSADGTSVKAWQAGTLLVYGAGAGKYTVVPATRIVTFGTAPGTGVVAIFAYEFTPGC